MSRNRRWDPSTAGLMTGLHDLDQGIGLDIVPSASLTNEACGPHRHAGHLASPTSSLRSMCSTRSRRRSTRSLTINTDFSATEVDDRQVNLTRFGLFFPEKRDFFLREADIFEFGRIGASDGTGSLSNARAAERAAVLLAPHRARHLGEPVDLDYGGKISGRIGRFELGALSIRQDENVFPAVQGREPAGADCVPSATAGRSDCRVAADTLSVVRAKASIGAESTVGAVFTDGDPLLERRQLARRVRLPVPQLAAAGRPHDRGRRVVPASDTEGFVGEDAARGLSLSIPSNAKFRGGLSMREVEANFNPALGFISRRDVRDYQYQLAYTHRPGAGYWQSMFWSLDGQRIEKLAGGLESQAVGLTPLQDHEPHGRLYFTCARTSQQEVLDVPFPISPGIVIPVGDYSFDDHGIEFGTSSFRKFSGRIAYTDGEFYDGTRSRVFGNFLWTPSPKFSTNFGYNLNYIDLPHGTQTFTTRIITTSIDWVFSSKLSWTNLIQYDNVSEIAGVNMRLNWIPEAGREFFFVINHNLQDVDRDNSFQTATSDVVAKMSYTFRF